jgi:hypothetical protein
MIVRSIVMTTTAERQRNQAAFRHLSALIQHGYPPRRFVAIADGKIVADAESFAALESSLKTPGHDSMDVISIGLPRLFWRYGPLSQWKSGTRPHSL